MRGKPLTCFRIVGAHFVNSSTGARLPPSYPSTSSQNGHTQRIIQKGEPLAVYAGELQMLDRVRIATSEQKTDDRLCLGELMRSKDAYERDESV